MVIGRGAPRRSSKGRRWMLRLWVTGLSAAVLAPLAVWIAIGLTTAAAVAQLTGLVVAVLAIFSSVITNSRRPEREPRRCPDPAGPVRLDSGHRARHGYVAFLVCTMLLAAVLLLRAGRPAWGGTRDRRTQPP